MSFRQAKTVEHDRFPWVEQAFILNWVLTVQFLACLPLMFYLKPWIGAVVFSAIVYRYSMERFNIKPVAQWVRVAIVFASAAVLVAQHAGLSGREAGVSLAVLMYGLKAIEVKRNRDIIVALFIGYFLIVALFLYNQSVFIALYAVILVVIITAGLIHCFSHLSSPTLNNVFGSLKMSAKLLAQAVPLSIILFLFFPRFSEPLWNLQSKGAAGTGVSDSMHPGAIGNLALDNSVAFRIKFFGSIPSSDQLYWRAMVLDQFDGKAWTVGERSIFNQAQIQTNSTPEAYEVTIESHNNPWLYHLEHSAIEGIGATPKDDLSWSLDYKLSRVARYRGAWYPDTSFDKTMNQKQWAQNTQIPVTGNPKTRQWAKRLWAQSNSTVEFLAKVEQFINQGPFRYTLQPPINRGDIIDDFFINSRQGFCEHYASALVYMMRSLGVPARVVVGYQGGEKNPLDDYYIVRQKDAHAWTEIWLPNQGWKRYDPTSWIHPSRVDLSLNQAVNQRSEALNLIDVSLSQSLSYLQQAGYMWDSFNQNWNDLFLNYNADKQIDIYQYFRVANLDWYKIGLLLVACILAFICIGVWFLVKRAPKRDAWEQWFHQANLLIIKAQNNKVSKKALNENKHHPLITQGPRATFSQLAQFYPHHKAQIEQAEAVYLKARYAHEKSNSAVPKALYQLLKKLPAK